MSASERSSRPTNVVIVGGSLSGATAANRLRELGFSGPIVIIDEDAHAPYDRPPLSKKLLGSEPLEEAANWAPTDCEWIRGHAVSFSAATHTVRVESADGEMLDVSGQAVVIATGAQARRLPFEPPGVLALRTLDDALALRERVQEGARSAVIIGAGAIGTEVASRFRDHGLSVTIIDAVELPLIRLLGHDFAKRAAAWISAAGVQLIMNSGVSSIHHGPGRWFVELSTGEVLSADIVVSAVGAIPCTQWLEGSGLSLDNGVRCDAMGRALGGDGQPLPGVYAAGDVAAWMDADGLCRRSEAWDNARLQGNDVAAAILGLAPDPRPDLEYFWTDQFARKVQVLGSPSLGDGVQTILEREARNSGVYRVVRGEGTVAWITVNAPREFAELARTGTLEVLENPATTGSAG